MRKTHVKNTVRYYIVLIVFLAFFFFTNDFGTIDVQKTAIVMATGIDKDEEGFVLTSQIAVPQASQQGQASQTVQLVSRGKTIAQAFDQINAKTGWYPKLVFCKLIIFGKQAAQENVFDALDFFLRDEYLTDDCQLAVCEGTAKELLNTSALVDPSSSTAISKVLSSHAERVGGVHPTNLKDFAIGYFGDSQSGVLPVLKTEPEQEPSPSLVGGSTGENGSQGNEEDGSAQSSQKESSENSSSEENDSSQGESSSNGDSKKAQDGQKGVGKDAGKPVFSAKQTALFVRGTWRETLNADETFALNAAIGKLRLANYTVPVDGQTCTLTIKHNLPKVGLNLGRDGRGVLSLRITLVSGITDYSKAQAVEDIRDIGTLPNGVFVAAEKKLSANLITAYEKAKGVGCDVFGIQERLVKYKHRRYGQHKDTLLNDTALDVQVKFERVR